MRRRGSGHCLQERDGDEPRQLADPENAMQDAVVDHGSSSQEPPTGTWRSVPLEGCTSPPPNCSTRSQFIRPVKHKDPRCSLPVGLVIRVSFPSLPRYAVQEAEQGPNLKAKTTLLRKTHSTGNKNRAWHRTTRGVRPITRFPSSRSGDLHFLDSRECPSVIPVLPSSELGLDLSPIPSV